MPSLASRPIRPAAYALAAALPFFAIVVACLTYVSRMDLPQYGVWTAIRPLETKIDLLERFAAKGEVDAVVFGSSIVDFGFSAELFSRLMTRHLGREYRAFNFATGGAEIHTLPLLYRIAHLVSRPKAIIVMMPPEPRLGENYIAAPNRVLDAAPIGAGLEHPWLLPLNRRIYKTALLRNAPAVRDLLMWGDFHNLERAVGMEAYRVDEHGDRVAHTFPWRMDFVRSEAVGNQAVTLPYAPDKGPDALHFYFGPRDIRAMDELREMAERDGTKLILASHAPAATWWKGTSRTETYMNGRRQFFEAFARRLGAEYWNVVDAPVTLGTYCIADQTHLNEMGAALYTRLMFDVATTGRPSAHDDCRADAPDFDLLKPSDSSLNLYSAVIERPAGRRHAVLWLRTVVSLAVPPLPQGEELYVALRFPDGKDVLFPAIATGGGDFMAEVDLPALARPQAVLVRLVGGIDEKIALSNPIAEYEWIDGFPRVMPHAPSSPGKPDIAAFPATRAAGESLYVALRGTPPSPQPPLLRLARADASSPAIDLGPGPRDDALARFPLPADLPRGRYAVEVVEAGTPIARSAAIDIAGRNEPVEGPRIWAASEIPLGRTMRVSWSGIRTPTLGDWIGLFPLRGGPYDRVELINIGPRGAGELDHPIVEGIKPKLARGEYEFRLYANGGWRLLARSQPVRFVPATPR